MSIPYSGHVFNPNQPSLPRRCRVAAVVFNKARIGPGKRYGSKREMRRAQSSQERISVEISRTSLVETAAATAFVGAAEVTPMVERFARPRA